MSVTFQMRKRDPNADGKKWNKVLTIVYVVDDRTEKVFHSENRELFLPGTQEMQSRGGVSQSRIEQLIRQYEMAVY